MKPETERALKGLGVVAGVLGIAYFASKVQAKPCTPGDTKCIGYDLYKCYATGGVPGASPGWMLEQANSPSCDWEPGLAEFTVTGLVIEPFEVYVGEKVFVSVTVTNIGNATGTKTVVLEGISSADVTLGAGDSQVVTFEVIPEEAGVYPVNISGLSGSFTVLPSTEKITFTVELVGAASWDGWWWEWQAYPYYQLIQYISESVPVAVFEIAPEHNVGQLCPRTFSTWEPYRSAEITVQDGDHIYYNPYTNEVTFREPELAMLYGYLQGAPGYPDDLTIIRIQGSVDVAGIQATTDSQGNYEVYGIEPGEHQITFSSPGYQDAVRTTEFHSGEEKYWTPILHPAIPQETIGMQIVNPPPGATHFKFTVKSPAGARSSEYTPVSGIGYPRNGSYLITVPTELISVYVCTLDYSIWEEWWAPLPRPVIDSFGTYEFDWDTKTLVRIE